MIYEKTVEFDGDKAEALKICTNTLLPHGFRITDSSDTSLQADGPGYLMVKGQDPMVGVSKISVSVRTREIEVTAELGGVDRIVKFMIALVVGLAVFFVVLFGIIFGIVQQQSLGKILLLSLAPFIPWPVIIPVMAVFLKKRTCRALDALIHNMVTLAK